MIRHQKLTWIQLVIANKYTRKKADYMVKIFETPANKNDNVALEK